ncbi:AbiJ-NTD4 domain-containing protein [Variovorax sp. Varisp41]|uniref:AbiJ-NTD4 domain-containing protein n=1 Tax=Variovorax sp. Varisp41 TaxID=3243033 RepID=UPI0039B3C093
MDRFSSRHGYGRPDSEITIRHEAPQELREAIIRVAYQCGFKPNDLRKKLCALMYKAPDPNNWSGPNVDREVHKLFEELEWFEVYDMVELLLQSPCYSELSLEDELNRCFRRMGVGWQLIDAQLEVRGPEMFEVNVRQGVAQLQQQSRHTAASELHEALQDLSRRPDPEITGAIQHALAALECVARDVCSSKDTLGELVKRNPGLFPKPIDDVVSKAWGFTSNFGRHLQEGQPPQFEEAELMVGLSGALCKYLARRVPRSAP